MTNPELDVKLPDTNRELTDLRDQPWFEQAMAEAMAEARRRLETQEQSNSLAKYRSDPVGFCRDILDDTFPPAIERVLESIRDNPITIAKSANGVGKSFAAARAAAWFYIVYPDSAIYMTAAPPAENLEQILWGHLMTTIRNKRDLFSDSRIKAKKVYRTELSFITRVTIPNSGTSAERQAKFAGKHAGHTLFIVDEGDAVPPEVYDGIESCMSGGDAHLLIMFNPRASQGPVYDMESRGLANVINLSALDHPNVITGDETYPGAVNREVTVRRINMWTRPLQEGERFESDCFVVPDFLVGSVAMGTDGKPYPPLQPGNRKIMDPAFSYMVLGEYPAQSEMQLINIAWINAARRRWDEYVKDHGERPPQGLKPIMGLDVADEGSDSSVACFRYGDYVTRFKFWQGVDPDLTADKALELYYETSTDVIMVDGLGIGSSVAPAMARRGHNRNVRAVSVKVNEKPSPAIKIEQGDFYSLRDQLWWRVREWLRTNPNSMLPPDPWLIEELKTPTYKSLEQNGRIKVMGKEKLRELLKRSTDRADSLCLTFTPYERPKVVRLR